MRKLDSSRKAPRLRGARLAFAAFGLAFTSACDSGSQPGTTCGSPCEGGPGDPLAVTAAELVADPSAYAGHALIVTGAPSGAFASCTAAACGSLPCNWCYGGFLYASGDGTVRIPLEASAAYVPDVVAGTVTPPQVATLPSATTTFGCVGHELEEACAPSIAEAITSVSGRLERRASGGSEAFVLSVDSVAVDRAHATTAGCYGVTEPSCVRHSATTPVGADGG